MLKVIFPSSGSWKPLGFLSCRKLQLNWNTSKQTRLDQSHAQCWPFTCNVIVLTVPSEDKTNEQCDPQQNKQTTKRNQYIPSQFWLGSGGQFLLHRCLLKIHCHLTPSLQSHLTHCRWHPRGMASAPQSGMQEMHSFVSCASAPTGLGTTTVGANSPNSLGF